MTAPDIIKQLVARFEEHHETYRSGRYNETQLRREFLDPFFEALGWDVFNKGSIAEMYKDVIHEDSLDIEGENKAPDYGFRVGGQRKFFLEAKKPAVNIEMNIHPAFQLRRYAWSAKLPLSILSDFEEFAVYDCRVKPDKGDKASTGRVTLYSYKNYVEKWDEIASIFSREAVLAGSFDSYAESMKTKKGTTEVDDAFLLEIERWRDLLAKNIALRNQSLSVRELNYAVQMTIDRIVFLRICEDRGVEQDYQLKEIAAGKDVYAGLCVLFKHADARYNSGLFHFKDEKDQSSPTDSLTLGLKIDDKPLQDILKNLYYPESPYVFREIPSDILGQVYERFLGKVIRLTASHQAKVEEKPEVRKAGGVYYTPTYIVEYIVQNTVGKLLEGKTPKEAAKLKIVDPACGSGTFPLGAYQYLLDWHLKWYIENEPEKWITGKSPAIYEVKEGHRLTTSKKKEILLNNIFGVDIDAQAVEVTKLSLLLKVLEGENSESIGSQLAMFQERVLPDLSKNIQCGNSLIGPDYFDGQQLTMGLADDEVRFLVNAFNWQREFSSVFIHGGFDAVIGNPPYVFGGNYGIEEEAKKYFKEHFYSGARKVNLFTLFIEKSVNILRDGGLVSYIIPNTLLRVTSYAEIREFMLKNSAIKQIADLGAGVFSGATTSSIIIVLEKSKEKTENMIEIRTGIDTISQVTRQSEFLTDGYVLNIKATSQDTEILSRLSKISINLGELCQELIFGVVITKNREEVVSEKPLRGYKPFLEGKDISRYLIRSIEKYLLYKPELLHRPRTPRIFEAAEKLLIQRITGGKRPLNAAYDNQQFYNKESINNIILKDDTPYNAKYILGLINSLFINWFYRTKFTNSSTLTVNLSKEYLSQIPIRAINFADPTEKARHDKMVSLVERMLTLHKQSPRTPQEQEMVKREIESTDRAIDKLVYELYGLSEDEIKIVEG
jgi:hypothetical protein